jgi:peroxiredoxin
LADRPFAIVGVNISENTAESLMKVMNKEKLNWRSFADVPGDDGRGTIAKKWNLIGTPTLYILDHRGIIRHKWTGGASEKTIDAALDKVIKEAEGANREPE